jgi:hypothetical protein
MRRPGPSAGRRPPGARRTAAVATVPVVAVGAALCLATFLAPSLAPSLAPGPARLAAAAEPAAPAFGFPVDCAYGEDCFIQNYVDHDPGPGRSDYACGRLSYDGHAGTDVRLARLVDLDRDVAVLAAADGTVLRVRDGMADRLVDEASPGAILGREAGNGVVIDHGNGWETQYSHLRQNSVPVAPGDPVRRGDPIGAVGLSGNTEFPHVEFTVRHRGRPLDPFVGPPADGGGFTCGGARRPVWTGPAAEMLVYQETAGLAAGFADERPNAATARRGGYDGRPAAADRPLVLWVDAMGVRAGDRQHFRITGPDGQSVHERTATVEDSFVSWFAFSGTPAPSEGWPPGLYNGHYTLSRDGETVVTMQAAVERR